MKKITHFILKTIVFSLLASFVLIFTSTGVFAAGARLSSSAVKASKGDTLSGNTLNITVGRTEIDILKDTITLTLDGAEWNGYDDEGTFTSNVSYSKISDSEIKIQITPTEKMLSDGCTIPVPLKCTVTNAQAEIAVNVSYGVDGYTDARVVFAKCSYTRAYLNGNVIERKTGAEVYSENQPNTSYNNLKITVIGDDVYRTKTSITVTLVGMKWTRLDKSGNLSSTVTYKKIDSNTISLQLIDMTEKMRYSGYTVTIPLTGTVTGTGELKAVVDFGYDDIPQSEVVFGYCKDGEVSLTSSSLNEVNNVGRVDDIVITDSSTQSFKKNTKFTVTIDQAYSFFQVPDIKGTGKFEDKCSVSLTASNTRQCIINMTDSVDYGETGTIVLSNVIIEKSSSTIPRSESITVTMEGSGWEDYVSSASIAKYSADAEFTIPLRLTANIADANEYCKLGKIVLTDKENDRSYKLGEKIVLVFDNDFYWFTEGSLPKLTLTGKFADACEFQFNPDNKSEAYIVFRKSVSAQNVGTISITGAQVTRDSEGYFETLNMTAYVESDPDTANTVRVGRYKATVVGDLTTTTTTTTNEATTETTTEDEDSGTEDSAASSDETEVKFVIGEAYYYINDEEYELYAAPYIKDGYTMLPVRVLANLVGITDDNIEYADGTAVFKSGETVLLEISAGETSFKINNIETELSTSAEIKNGTMFLPMRDLVNALGISDENISFDSETKIVTIYPTV
ncbi:MAG: copper amine oxidase N-terminal domain-containing protein [Clostridiales bacterium]|nr:copper amine oxidase N-terminal domain-containing protein [Clostridiales bacterium]